MPSYQLVSAKPTDTARRKPVISACPVCSARREQVFAATVLGKYEVDYFYCDGCGFLQTQDPFWLEEAYVNVIADADTGLVSRNLAIARRLSAILYFQYEVDGTYLDSAGGYGLLTRLLRDIGFDFLWHDDYCENLLARGFEGVGADRPMTAVTAFEVLEHVMDPLQFIDDTLRRSQSRTLIFSTELFEGSPPDPESWWYYAREAGQHVSFYQKRTLEVIANNLSLRLHTNGAFHVLTDREVSGTLFNFLTGKGSWLGYAWARARLKSLTLADHERAIGRYGGKQN